MSQWLNAEVYEEKELNFYLLTSDEFIFSPNNIVKRGTYK